MKTTPSSKDVDPIGTNAFVTAVFIGLFGSLAAVHVLATLLA